MATGDLITDEYLTTGIPAMVPIPLAERARLISTASQWLTKQVGTVIVSTAITEEKEVGSNRLIRLDNLPVISIDSIKCDLSVAIAVTYAGAAQRASITYGATGIVTCSTNTSGVIVNTTFNITTYPLVSSLAAAIATVAGFGVVTTPVMAALLSADLRPSQGTLSVLNATANVYAYKTMLNEWDLKSQSTGSIQLDRWMPDTYRFPDQVWGADRRNARIQVTYTAGYSPVPDDIQRATCSMCQYFYDATSFTGALIREKIGDYEYNYSQSMPFPQSVRMVINNYPNSRLRIV